MTYTIPRATYRLQLTKDFTFADAAGVAPYLAALGVSHAYLSPVLKARPGSTHGYDTVDHRVLNPELGSYGDFELMAAAFRAHGLGLIVDIVPNHMGIGGDQNDLWLDVLKYGRNSRYAEWFDINWRPAEPSLHGKVLVPFLGESLGESLEKGRIELKYDRVSREMSIWAEGTHRLPLSPESYSLVGDESAVTPFNAPEGRSRMLALLEAQHWRLARFSVAADDINYRRFFIVSDLAAIRVERPEVFSHIHSLTFDLVASGLVDGLRVDHIDGLYDPKGYCQQLRAACPKPVYLVVEKILAGYEMLREDWGVDGTTGYEFASAATRLITDRSSEGKLSRLYETFTGRTQSLSDIEQEAKRSIVDFEMAAELEALSRRLREVAARDPRTADYTYNGLRHALRDTVVAMPVYRTYVDQGPLDERDNRWIASAVAAARKANPLLDGGLFDFLHQVMAVALPDRSTDECAEIRDIAMRIQQYTGPVMAKGLEDTALYRFNRLIALSDVGEKPDRFGSEIASFHDWAKARAQYLPHGMLGSSSHDSKRGEDARARIAALSSRPDEWSDAVYRWSALLGDAAAGVDPNDVYYFYQLFLGSWPTDFPEAGPLNSEQLDEFEERLNAAMRKSAREARVRTNWAAPRSDYEADLARLVSGALGNAEFLADFREFESRIGRAGAQNGLIETTLKLTLPGVPDFYQGAELWEQSMVDPDNRRAVDYARRIKALAEPQPEMVSEWRNGSVKQRLIADILADRRRRPALFALGTYEPVAVPDELPVMAFARRHQDQGLLVVIRFAESPSLSWSGGKLELACGALQPVLCGGAAGLELQHLFPILPVAVMEFAAH